MNAKPQLDSKISRSIKAVMILSAEFDPPASTEQKLISSFL